MKPNILFVVMSAVHSAATVDQLARALAPHRVLVHHDFSQTPAFELHEPNVCFVPQPKRTGWGVWGFVDGIFHSLRHALADHEFDYLQLLSATCLPIKSMAAFERHVSDVDSDAHADAIDLLADCDALMHVGYRVFAPEHTFRQRVLKRLSSYYFDPNSGRQDVAGVQLRAGIAMTPGGRPTVLARIAYWALQGASNPMIGRHIFGEGLRPYFGSPWFGARRNVIAEMVDRFSQSDIQRYGPKIWSADEFLVPTLLRNSGARLGPSGHLTNRFIDARPEWFADEDFPRLQQAPQYFARKFPDDSSASIRHRILAELVGVQESALTAH